MQYTYGVLTGNSYERAPTIDLRGSSAPTPGGPGPHDLRPTPPAELLAMPLPTGALHMARNRYCFGLAPSGDESPPTPDDD